MSKYNRTTIKPPLSSPLDYRSTTITKSPLVAVTGQSLDHYCQTVTITIKSPSNSHQTTTTRYPTTIIEPPFCHHCQTTTTTKLPRCCRRLINIVGLLSVVTKPSLSNYHCSTIAIGLSLPYRHHQPPPNCHGQIGLNCCHQIIIDPLSNCHNHVIFVKPPPHIEHSLSTL